MPNYPQEKLWALYEKLPPRLKEAIFSQETAEIISKVCDYYGIEKEKISEIAKNVGYVFLGILPPEKLENVLAEELEIKVNLAKAINSELQNSLFFLYKSELDSLYGKGSDIPSKKITSPPRTPQTKMETPSFEIKAELLKESAKNQHQRDIYREPIE